jgi:hypothetical protein
LTGVFYGLFRFDRFCSKKEHEYEDAKRNWLHSHGIVEGTEIPENLRDDFKAYLKADDRWSYEIDRKLTKSEKEANASRNYYQQDSVKERVIQVRPLGWRNKAKMINWMTYWPWSLTWWLLDDFVRGIFRYLQRKVANLMEVISKRHFKGVESDYTVTTPADKS